MNGGSGSNSLSGFHQQPILFDTLADGTLVITGSEYHDHIQIWSETSQTSRRRSETQIYVLANGVLSVHTADAVRVDLRGGDDILLASEAAPEVLDTIHWNRSQSTLLRHNASDSLSLNVSLYAVGGNGDDILIGGAGSTRLFGGNGNDLLYGGRSTFVSDGGSGENLIFRVI